VLAATALLRRILGSKGMAGDLTEIGRDLLVMEISTIESDSVTGHKMPWFPHAVIDILTKYADWFVFTRELKMGTILALPGPLTRDVLLELSLDEAPDADTKLTNGWRSIEQIRRTAKLLVDDEVMRELGKKPLNDIEQSLANRIRRNCDQLKTVIVRFRGVDPWQHYFLSAAALKNVAEARTDTGSNGAWSTFREADNGLSRLGIAKSLERSGTPEKAVLDSDAAIRLRKIWELGTDIIVAQTIVHVDGDTVTKFQRGVEQEKLTYFLDIHNQGVETAVRQWGTLFEAFRALIGGVANAIFGRSV